MKFCRMGIARCIYLAVGGSILVRTGGDIYTCDGRGEDRLGELTPSKILAKCPLYSKMAEGPHGHILALGFISRAT